MKPLRRTNRATVQWIADRVLEYVQDYDTAYQSLVSGKQLTTEEQSRWSVQMILHQFRVTDGELTDEVRLQYPDVPPLTYTKDREILYVFQRTMREQGYDDQVIDNMIESRLHVIMDFPQVFRAPGANYALAPLVEASNQHPSHSVRNSLSHGIMVALLALPNSRQTIHRAMETLRTLIADDQRLQNADLERLFWTIKNMQSYANLLLIAMVQHTNTRITYRDDVPYDWQYPMFLETLNTVVDEHHDTIQQVLYTAGMSVRRGSRKVNHHILSDGLLTVARLERDVKRSKNT